MADSLPQGKSGISNRPASSVTASALGPRLNTASRVSTAVAWPGDSSTLTSARAAGLPAASTTRPFSGPSRALIPTGPTLAPSSTPAAGASPSSKIEPCPRRASSCDFEALA